MGIYSKAAGSTDPSSMEPKQVPMAIHTAVAFIIENATDTESWWRMGRLHLKECGS